LLFITGDTGNAQAIEFLSSAGVPYLTKPLDKQTLLAKVAAHLQQPQGVHK